MNMDELMLNKSFSQLSEDEKNFVLGLLGSESEYEEMRNMLMDIKQSFAEEEEIVPDEKIKKSLMGAFESKHQKNGKVVSLNRNKNILRSPVFQLAAVGLIVIGIGVLLFNTGIFTKNQLAVNKNDITTKTDESLQPSVSLNEDSLSANKTTLSGTTLPTAEESKPIAADETKQPIILDLKEEKNTFATVDNDKLILDDRGDKEAINTKTISGNELTKKEELQKPLKENEKNKKDSYSGASLKDTSYALAKTVNTAPASANRQYTEAIVTDNLSGSERKENKKQGEYRDRATQEKKSNSISLAEKPELIEFLFTAL